jgi:hypothetical protein
VNFAQITIYDIVGYFMPGVFSMCGLYLLACPWLVTLEPNWNHMTLVKWFFLGLCAYVLGHCIQGVANWLEARRGWPKRQRNRKSTTEKVMDPCSQHYATVTAWARERLGVPDIKPSVLCEIMDAHVMQQGKTETRDIYVYREGFYRGLYVAFGLIAIGTIVRLLSTPTCTIFGGRVILLPQLLWFGLSVSFTAGVLCYYRFRRFEEYRIKFALMAFVALKSPASLSPGPNDGNNKKGTP